MPRNRRRAVWAFGATAAVAVAVVAAAWQLGSPLERRLRRLDEQRRGHLRSLSSEIRAAWDKNGKLPDSVAALARQPSSAPIERDPETGEPYKYEQLGERRFRLCATFARPSPTESRPRENDFWVHPAGEHCFDLEIEVGAGESGESPCSRVRPFAGETAGIDPPRRVLALAGLIG